MSEIEAAKIVGAAVTTGPKVIEAVSKLFPGILMGGKRRAYNKDISELRKMLDDIEADTNLPQEEKAVIRYSLYQNLGHINNLSTIVQGSIPLIKNPSGADKINSDWVDDFQDKAARCSDPDLQKIWSQILAGEIDSVGRFSKKILSTLAILDRTDAEAFKALCSYAAKQYHPEASNSVAPAIYLFLTTDDTRDGNYNNNAVTISEIETLNEIGLINWMAWNRLDLPPGTSTILETSKETIVLMNKGSETVQKATANYMLTKTGIALSSLCELGTAVNFHTIVRKSFPGQVSIGVTKRIQLNDSAGSYSQSLEYL